MNCFIRSGKTGQLHSAMMMARFLIEDWLIFFNKYNLKATFHLNSGTLDTEGFIKTQELKSLYQGHEIACHGVAHEYPTHLSQERLVQEFYQDRCSLERETGRIIRGCSYAFGEYDENVISTHQKPGALYTAGQWSLQAVFALPKDP